MLNRLYDRKADKVFVDKHSKLITPFKDLERTHWGYYDLVEAFESHAYTKKPTGEEEWIRLIDAKVPMS